MVRLNFKYSKFLAQKKFFKNEPEILMIFFSFKHLSNG